MNRAAGLAKLGNVFRKILRLSRSFANVWPIDAHQPTVRRVRLGRHLRNRRKHLEVRFRAGDHEVPRDFYSDTDYFAPVIIGQPYLSMNLDKLRTIRAAGCGANESLWNDNCDRIVPRRLSFQRNSAFTTTFYRFEFFSGIVRVRKFSPSNFR